MGEKEKKPKLKRGESPKVNPGSLASKFSNNALQNQNKNFEPMGIGQSSLYKQIASQQRNQIGRGSGLQPGGSLNQKFNSSQKTQPSNKMNSFRGGGPIRATALDKHAQILNQNNSGTAANPANMMEHK